jgi:uncharacterized membrane protein
MRYRLAMEISGDALGWTLAVVFAVVFMFAAGVAAYLISPSR